MRKLTFKATKTLPAYRNPTMLMRAGEVKEIEDGVAEYLLSTFPNNFEEQLETNENGLEGAEGTGVVQVPAKEPDPAEDTESVEPDPAEESEDDSLGKPEPTVEEVKTSANNTAPKRTNKRKRGSGVPKTKLFGK